MVRNPEDGSLRPVVIVDKPAAFILPVSTRTTASPLQLATSPTAHHLLTSHLVTTMAANKTSAVADMEPVDVLFVLHEKFNLMDFAGPLE